MTVVVVDEDEWGRVRAADESKAVIQVSVTGCAYACCGRPWSRRDYRADYSGYVDNFEEQDGEAAGTFMLYSVGIGTISYIIACRDYELVEVL